MSKMVERVARAMAAKGGWDPDECEKCMSDPLGNTPRWHLFTDLARAAIHAMDGDPGHDVTEAVLQPTEDRGPVLRMWMSMIKACLT